MACELFLPRARRQILLLFLKGSLTCLATLLLACVAQSQTIGNHTAVYDSHGVLQPWTSWRDALNREVQWYLKCPSTNAYPVFVAVTFMEGDYRPNPARPDCIPAMQNGMGIISYLKFFAWGGRTNAAVLGVAKAMGDFLVKEGLTPNYGKYPAFPRSTGRRFEFPLPPDCGSQADQPYEIEPDKGAIAGYGLTLLWRETKDARYLDAALHIARVLANNVSEGTGHKSPWPFRADFRTGLPRGEVASNQSFSLRLFDALIDLGYPEFNIARNRLWTWIKRDQIPSAGKDGALWVQFFEDYALTTNRNSWAPMNLARYLCERKTALDPDWQEDARVLIDFATRNFTTIQSGVLVCGEQDDDHHPWGGALSTYGGALAVYCKATGSNEFKGLAWQALNYALYSIDEDGCPSDGVWKGKRRGGWQEDADTDKLHNFMDALGAFPEWAD